jgi:DNA-binding LacI/PurR family transcriptional regulator
VSRELEFVTPTLKQVAKLAGVSTSAVSRAHTEGASVSAETRAKVAAAAVALGYVPSLIARSLATSRTKLVGLVANNFQNPVFLDVFDLYTRALQVRGFRPLLINLTDVTDPSDSVRLLRQYSVDGVVIATSTLPPAFAVAFRDAGLRIVHAFGRASRRPPVHVVGIDNVAAGRLAARTLRARGYRRLAFLGGPEAATSTQDRAAGFVKELEAADVHPPRLEFARAYSYDAGREAIGALLGEARLEAIFCGDDLICMGAMDGAREAGRAVPGDLGFLGFNDMSMAGWAPYSLTTIRQPIDDIIRHSVELVLALVEDPAQAPKAMVFPCSVVDRSTLRPYAVTGTKARS